MPLPYCGIANGPALDTVAVPAVTVDTPAPMFWITKVSPALNNDVLTVTVFALATFITMRVEDIDKNEILQIVIHPVIEVPKVIEPVIEVREVIDPVVEVPEVIEPVVEQVAEVIEQALALVFSA